MLWLASNLAQFKKGCLCELKLERRTCSNELEISLMEGESYPFRYEADAAVHVSRLENTYRCQASLSRSQSPADH